MMVLSSLARVSSLNVEDDDLVRWALGERSPHTQSRLGAALVVVHHLKGGVKEKIQERAWSGRKMGTIARRALNRAATNAGTNNIVYNIDVVMMVVIGKQCRVTWSVMLCVLFPLLCTPSTLTTM